MDYTALKKRSALDRIYLLILLFFSIEYVGDGVLSVYRLVVFPLLLLGLAHIFNKRNRIKNATMLLIFIAMMIWFTIARLVVNDNWLFPLFNIPLGLFLLLYYNRKTEINVDYGRVFSIYSLPHIIALVGGFAYWDEGIRFAGAHNDPNFCSISLVIAIIASVSLLLNKSEKKGFRIYAFLNILISLILLWLAGSRGAIVSLLIVAAFVFMLSSIRKIYKFIVIVIFFIGLQYLQTYIMSLPDWVNPEIDPVEAFFSRFKPESLSNGSGRHEIWDHVIRKLQSGDYFITPLGREKAMAGVRNEYTHNTFLDFVVENGILVGLIDLFILLICIIKTGLALLKKELSYNNKLFALLALSLMSQLFLLSGISNKLFWIMFIFMMSIQELKIKRS